MFKKLLQRFKRSKPTPRVMPVCEWWSLAPDWRDEWPELRDPTPTLEERDCEQRDKSNIISCEARR